MGSYLGIQNDGLLYAAPNEEEFIAKYQEKWKATMSDTYFQSEQIDIGHKLRPRLVFWGYTSNSLILDDLVLDDVAQIAVCIELIHKASLLIDDYIDKDTTRHGKPAFYITYGIERTIIYSLNLLSKSLELLNSTYFHRLSINSFYFKSINDITLTLQAMTLGVLRELDLNGKSIIDLTEIKTIMDLETSSLITNSLLMGYYLSNQQNDHIEATLKSVGQKLGYVFQILNDMESFYSTTISDHKGSANTDIDRARKNICIPVLASLLSLKDKKKLMKAVETYDASILYSLMEKYRVKDILEKEIYNVKEKISNEIMSNRSYYSRERWGESFIKFIDSVLKVFLQRIV